MTDPETTEPKPSPQARWKQANVKAVWAQAALRSAVKRGLVTPGPCEVCGAEKTDGHHPDYDRPAFVQWLCRRHHKAEHRRTKGGAG